MSAQSRLLEEVSGVHLTLANSMLLQILELCYKHEMKSFRDKMLEVRPAIAVREAEFPEKIKLAMELRALRDGADLDQEQIAILSELSLEDIHACESLTGEMPRPEKVAAYRSAVWKNTSAR